MKNCYLKLLVFILANLNLHAQEYNWAHAYDAGGMNFSTNKIKTTPDRQGGVILAMNFQDSINSNPQQPSDFTEITAAYGVIISRLDANGNEIFSHYIETSYYAQYNLLDVQVKSDGTFYVVATSQGATYPFNVDPTGGSFLINNQGLVISSFDINGNFISAKVFNVEPVLFKYFEGAISENDEFVINGCITYNSQFSDIIGEGISNGSTRRSFTVTYDENLNYVWGDFFSNAAPASYSVFNYGNVAISPNGNTYSSMAIGGSITLSNGSTYSASNNYDALIIEYDATGSITNEFLYTSTAASDYIQSIAVGNDNRIAVIGYAHGATNLDVEGSFAGSAITGNSQFYFALYDESFNLLHYKSDMMGNTRPKSCRFNSAGDLLIAGRLFNTFDFDFVLGGNQFYNLLSANYDIFMAKYDNQLNVIYAKKAGNPSNYGDVEKLHVDEFENIFIAGEFGTSAVDMNFGVLTNNINGTLNPYGYIAKYAMCEQYISTENVNVCVGSNYTFPDGYTSTNIQSTVSRTIYDSQISSCDSIITIVVNPNPFYNIQEDIEICSGDGYTFPDGTTLSNIQTNTSHTSNLMTIAGCDSTIITTIQVNPIYNTQENVILCQGENYIFPDGSTQSNIQINTSYASSFTTTAGCDSLIITNIQVNPSYNLQENVAVCFGENYTFPDGTVQTNIQADVNHTSSLFSASGCDSIITTTIIVKPIYHLQETASVCYGDSYTFPDGMIQTNISTSLSYTSNFNSVSGCDSIIITIINVTTINSTVTQTGNSLEVAQANANYQWYDCSDNSIVPNGTDQQVTLNQTGSYQVEIQYNGCTSTSDCQSIDVVGILENNTESLKVYPNPTTNLIIVEYNDGIENIEIYSVDGKLVYHQPGNQQTQIKIDLSSLTTGNYHLLVSSNGVKTPMKIVKN